MTLFCGLHRPGGLVVVGGRLGVNALLDAVKLRVQCDGLESEYFRNLAVRDREMDGAEKEVLDWLVSQAEDDRAKGDELFHVTAKWDGVRGEGGGGLRS